MKKLILLITASICTLTLLAQTEVELRSDGIVVPRTDTSSVIAPVEGMIIYDTLLEAQSNYNGRHWSVQGSIDDPVITTPSEATVLGSILGSHRFTYPRRLCLCRILRRGLTGHRH